MSDKAFIISTIIVLAICLLLTLAHLAYIGYAYQNSSIIYFVSQEIWP
ncbi:hypothetical protein SAMN02910456_00136 [Ruminococcaceae bacterium YRB3002]|nr:hypothetical protein SAMN02910456_00136 [Ruminococcaceae bacterium YRB3002]